MKFLLALGVFLTGFALPFQMGMNAQLRETLGNGLLGALANFIIGSLALALLVLAFRVPLPSLASISQTPGWAWFGGILGALLVIAATFAARELGALPILVLGLLGQAIGSILVDHYGWAGYPVRPISLAKITACVLLVVSVFLVKYADSATRH